MHHIHVRVANYNVSQEQSLPISMETQSVAWLHKTKLEIIFSRAKLNGSIYPGMGVSSCCAVVVVVIIWKRFHNFSSFPFWLLRLSFLFSFLLLFFGKQNVEKENRFFPDAPTKQNIIILFRCTRGKQVYEPIQEFNKGSNVEQCNLFMKRYPR